MNIAIIDIYAKCGSLDNAISVFWEHECKRYTGLVCDDCGIMNTWAGAKGDIYVQGNDEGKSAAWWVMCM